MKVPYSTLGRTAGIVLAGSWVYAPALRGGWIWDDTFEIPANPALRDLAGLRRIWLAPDGPDYLPVKSTVQWCQWHLWQSHPLGYHLTNLGLHLLSALLVWRILGRWGVPAAWLGALLFTIHPVAVESIAWISELKNALSLPFLLLALDAYLDYDRQGGPAAARRSAYFRALLWFALSLLAKSSGVMFPVVGLLYVWWRRGRIERAEWRASVPFFALSLVLGLVTVWFQTQRAIGAVEVAGGGFLTRWAAAGWAILFYLGKCLFPVGLAPIYPRWSLLQPAWWQFLPWLALGLALAWIWPGRGGGERRTGGGGWRRAVVFGFGFFLVNLLPVLGFVNMAYVRISRVGDQFCYLPLLGLVGLAAAGWSTWQARARGPVALAVALAACVLLAGASRRYAGIFANEETFWAEAVRRNPAAWMAENNLGLAFAEEGRLAEAIGHYEAALRQKPDYAEAHYNLGVAWGRAGQGQTAIAEYRQALQLNPLLAQAHNNLGNLLAAIPGGLAEAIVHYEEAVRLKPDDAGAWDSLGRARDQTGRPDLALGCFSTAVRLRPDFAAAHVDRGDALAGLARRAESLAEYDEALRLRPNYAIAHSNRGRILAALGRLPEAIAEDEAALRLDPALAVTRNNLGEALARSGRLDEARAQFQEAVRLQPDYGAARGNLLRLGGAPSLPP